MSKVVENEKHLHIRKFQNLYFNPLLQLWLITQKKIKPNPERIKRALLCSTFQLDSTMFLMISVLLLSLSLFFAEPRK
jgi:hypothetical protein